MELAFTDEAIDDLEFIHHFLLELDVINHQAIVENIIIAANKLLVFPRIGVPVQHAETLDLMRDYFYEKYVLRYLITDTHIFILRIWHQKENERNE